MHDGAIVFKTKIDNSEVQKDLDRVKRDIDKSQKSIAESEGARLPLLKDAERLKIKLQEARQELAFIKEEQAAARAAIGGESLDDHLEAYDRLPALNAAVDDQKRKVDSLEKEWAQVNNKITQYNQKIAQAQGALTAQKAKAGELSAQLTRGGLGMSGAMEKAQKSADRFKRRLTSIVGQVFVFTLVSKALQGITRYMGKALKSNKEFTAELAKLKGALLTAFQPIYELLLPALMAMMRIATSVVTAVARVAALLGGKSMSQYAKNAEVLYDEANAIDKTGEAAKKAQRSLAGFDEINQLSSNSSESDASQGTSNPDFSAFDSSAIKQEVDELVLYLSGALLLIGMVLALSGANIPLGIGLMAVGAIGLATEAATNWDAVKQIISEQTDLIMAISSILLVIGIVLAFSGCAIPLGIGLMIAGATGLATAAAVDWSSVRKVLEEQAAWIAGISAVLLVIGIILCFCGVLPLGIGLIVVGAAGLVTEAVVNWDSIKGPVMATLSSLLAILSGASMVMGVLLLLSGAGIGIGLALIAAGMAGSVVAWKLSDNPITRFVKGIANTIIGFVNLIIDAINSLFHIKFSGLKIGGVQLIPQIDTKLLNIPPIPLLAQGAVLPPNRPFMAMVGDQKHGTNIEAPLSTIQEAVAAVMADYEASNLAGHEATVEVLRQLLSAVLGIEVGDTTIGQAANRYNQKMAIIKGGL